MGILDRVRAQQAQRKAEKDRKQVERDAERARANALAAQRAAAAAKQQLEAEAVAQRARMVEILGPDLADFEVNTPDEAKIAIKYARLRKKELQAEKREVASELADVREQWRERQAGRMVTTGLGRGAGGRLVRASIQSKRRSERMGHAEEVNQYSDRRPELDYQITVIDRNIRDMERKALKPDRD